MSPLIGGMILLFLLLFLLWFLLAPLYPRIGRFFTRHQHPEEVDASEGDSSTKEKILEEESFEDKKIRVIRGGKPTDGSSKRSSEE